MFYLIRGNTKNSSISLARDGDPAQIADAMDALRDAGFKDVAVLDAMGREIDLASIQTELAVDARSSGKIVSPL